MSDVTSGQEARSVVSFFPLAWRQDLVKRSAIALDNHHGNAAIAFWRNTCRDLGAELIARGCPEEEMRLQILDFQAAVQVELLEMHRAELARG